MIPAESRIVPIPELLADSSTLPYTYHYEPIKKLASGGLGDVYLAREITNYKCWAIKIPQYPEYVPYFQREALALAHLSHPRIVALHDYRITDKGLPALVLEYCGGLSLSETLDREGHFDETKTRKIGRDLRDLLNYIHGMGILHLDVRPSNIQLLGNTVKLLDFGSTEFMRGTYVFCKERQTQGYEAPEIFNSRIASPASDFYSLGITLLACLKGTEDPQEMNRITLPKISRELVMIICALLSENPADRMEAAKIL